MFEANEKLLKCYCDHCPNNTCITNKGIGLCYAEWRLKVPRRISGSSDIHAPPTTSSLSSISASSSSSSSQLTSPLSSAASQSASSELFTSTSSSLSIPNTYINLHQQTTSNRLLIDSIPQTIDLEKRYNCFNKDDPLIIRTIVCNETVSSTSHVIRRCCSSSDYCNEKEDLLPSHEEASRLFGAYSQQTAATQGLLASTYTYYLNLPLGYKIFVTSMALLLIMYVIALFQDRTALRRKRTRAASATGMTNSFNSNQASNTSSSNNALKNFIVRIISLGRSGSGGNGRTGSEASRSRFRWSSPSMTRVQDSSVNPSEREGLASISPGSPPFIATTNISNDSPPRKQTSGRHDFDYSDVSSTYKQHQSDAAVFDTNSMTSREPLINSRQSRPSYHHHHHQQQILNQRNNPNSSNHPINQQYPGPFMTDGTTTGGNAPSVSFNMTLGSLGAPVSNKNETSSGSGAGQPYLTQRSIADDIELIEVVGRGYYGVVWRGDYKGEPVAVKIFSPMAERSWEREAEIYQTTMLRHKNILGLIATDKRLDSSLTGYWLVTDYYPMGSLHEFLRENSMSMSDAIRMAFSIANGLSHLHVEIFGIRGKPAIAHRDIKSKNVLVKNDGTCCIADLGMAVRYNSNTNVVDVPSNTRAGTRRYLAPEILDNRLNMMDFEGVKATDIYSLGLVLWEILRRACFMHPSAAEKIDPELSFTDLQSVGTNTPLGSSPKLSTTKESSLSTASGAQESPKMLPVICENYEVPYQDQVSLDPTAEEMYETVCVKKIRPTMSARWSKFGSMRDYANIMTECWYEKPQARLSALRVRKSLGDIAKKYFNMNMEYD